MGRKSKKFLDRSNAVTFTLIQRSTADGAEADPFILNPSKKDVEDMKMRNEARSGKGKEPVDDEDYEDDEEDDFFETKQEVKKGRKYREDDYEFGEYGFPDDGYDYTQHFKPTGGTGALFIPSVKKKENPVEIIQKSNERLLERIDPEILELLNDDTIEEGGDLQDDFFEVAGGIAGDPENLEDHLHGTWKSKKKDDFFVFDHLGRGGKKKVHFEDDEDGFDDEDFSEEYEEEDIGDVDEHFEAIEQQYDDDEVGELDEMDPSTRGDADISQFNDEIMDFLEKNVELRKMKRILNDKQTEELQAKMGELTVENETEEDKKHLKQKILEIASLNSDSEGEEEYVVEERVVEEDCVSVLSYTTNTENHPKLLVEPKKVKQIKLSAKTGIPIGVLGKKDAKEKAAATKSTASVVSEDRENLGKARSKEETPEEKKERKNAIKAERKANRERKKQLKTKFQKEEQRQKKVMSSNRTQPAVIF